MSHSPDAENSARETVFYDGACGLCHALVRFTAGRDRAGWFLFAPLGGEHFRATVREPPAPVGQTSRSVPGGAAPLPDSVAVLTHEGELLFRSAAVLHVLRRLGGGWRFLGAVAGLLPRGLLDWGYDRVARLRRKLFAPPAGTCPLVPEPLRSRFRL